MAGQTVNVGQTVSLNAVATDTNSLPPILTFSLLNAPAGATLTQVNNTNAAFSWRPAVSNANTTNLITLNVADNYVPSLSAQQSFTITVNPLALPALPSAGWSNGQFSLLVSNSIAGPDYAVQSSSNLLNWNTIFTTNLPATGLFQWTDTNTAAWPAQFFRVKVRPAAALAVRRLYFRTAAGHVFLIGRDGALRRPDAAARRPYLSNCGRSPLPKYTNGHSSARDTNFRLTGFCKM